MGLSMKKYSLYGRMWKLLLCEIGKMCFIVLLYFSVFVSTSYFIVSAASPGRETEAV